MRIFKIIFLPELLIFQSYGMYIVEGEMNGTSQGPG